MVTAWNALYTAPADLELREAFGKVKNSMVLALRDDETVRAASWRLAASHPLESWGDLRARDGTVSIVQPLITPLYESATEIDLLAAFVGEGDRGAWRLVREGWRTRSGAPPAPLPLAGAAAAANPVDTNRPRAPDPYDRTWDEWLAAGVLTESAGKPEQVAADLGAVGAALGKLPAPAGGIEPGFAPDYKIWDGRLLENAWLQELPDPVTKLTWENAAHLSPATAKRLGVAAGDLVELSRAGRSVLAPVLVVPGHADDAVTVALGYGQQVAGPVGKGWASTPTRSARATRPGSRAAPSSGRPASAPTSPSPRNTSRWRAAPSRSRSTTTSSATRRRSSTSTAARCPPSSSPSTTRSQTYKWGMAIDLSRCIGCGACMVACQAENNIPVVGKEQVLRSREMHWIRVDRYFEGPAEDPEVRHQPIACVALRDGALRVRLSR